MLSRCLAVLFVVVCMYSLPSSAQELDEHLSFLQLLLGGDWVGGYVGEGSPDLEIVLRFESILDGNAVRYTREAAGAAFASVIHFYWNASRREVRFLNLNNRGILAEGVAGVADDKVVLRGQSHAGDHTVEFETTLEIDAQGTLRDTYMRMQGGEWVTGHVQEFVRRTQ
jgi:hypothetical protein